MKHHIALKFLAILLCSVLLLTTLASGLGIAVLWEAELYSGSPEQLYTQSIENSYWSLAFQLANRYAAQEFSNAQEEDLVRYLDDYYKLEDMGDSKWAYRLYDVDGKLLRTTYKAAAAEGAIKLEYFVTGVSYPLILDRQEPGETTLPPEVTEENSSEASGTEPEPTQESAASETVPQLPDSHRRVIWNYPYDDGKVYKYDLAICDAPDYIVELYLLPGAYEEPDHWTWQLAQLGYQHRFHLFWVLGGSLLLFVALLVYLCCAAGRKPKSQEVCPAGLNRIPLDLYLGGVVLAITLCVVVVWDVLLWGLEYYEPTWLVLAGIGALALLCCLLAVGFLFACAAQMKVAGGWWLKHTATGFLLLWGFRLLKWILGGFGKLLRWMWKQLPAVGKGIQKLFQGLLQLAMILLRGLKTLVLGIFDLLGKGARLLWRGLRRFMGLLPLTWQWLLAAFVLVFLIAIAVQSNRLVAVGCLGICMAMVMYGAYCFGILLEGTKRMSQGDLEAKVEDKLLLGSFRDYAAYLNALAHVATEAAKKQMKSERMKAELVTNVSHDIKTPLTSIINYVDLLQKAGSQEEAEQYLEVLGRQSQRLKKLIEDLMEMSKASTGNMAVELGTVDAVEAVTQALGEFSEKLEQAQLVPVFDPPQGPVKMTADGRLTWRVLSNLLGNAVKYALPGTRLYIDVEATEDTVRISLKNISREQLNISSEELLERFVRGDASRNTEGSGLGLNIARSLMELQKGQLQLLVDGDLFKVTLIFRSC